MIKRHKEAPLAERRGVFQPFDYCITKRLAALLVSADVGRTAKALAREIGAKRWERDVFGKKLQVEGLSYSPFQLRGHNWTTIIGMLRFRIVEMKFNAKAQRRKGARIPWPLCVEE
jgi:hypothetical protein